MMRISTLVRIGAAALSAAALAATLQRPGAGTVVTLVAVAALTVAAFGMWLAPARPALRIGLLAPAGVLLVIATSIDDAAAAASHASARAAGPLALALVTASLVRPRLVIATAVIGGVVAGPLHMLFYDPFSDRRCRACEHIGGLAVWADTGRAETLWRLGMGLVVVAIAIGMAAELRRPRPELVGVLLAAGWFMFDPYRRHAVSIAVAIAVVVWARRCWVVGRRRVAIRRMLAAHEQSEGLAGVLRKLARDPTLEIAFPTAAGGVFVDAHGAPASVPDGRASTDLIVHGDVLARVSHAPTTRIPDLSIGLDPEIVLTLHNERLNAQLAARVEELTEERRRVVHAGLAERRMLERDLHDGVQQELLALGLDLRLTLTTLPDDSTDGPVLEQALALIHDCVDQVRAMSTGVSPPMLETRGLRAAVAALLRRRGDPAGVAVDLDGLPESRMPDEVERAVYSVLADAVARGATSIRTALVAGELSITAEGAHAGTHSDGTLPDLVAAVGGWLRSTPSAIEAVIPCA